MTLQKYRIAASIGMMAIGGCSRADTATTVVNRSAGAVTVDYVDALDGQARRLNLAPGATGRLARNEAISTLTALKIATADKTYDMVDWDAERKRLTCRGDCVITWQADRKIHIASERL